MHVLSYLKPYSSKPFQDALKIIDTFFDEYKNITFDNTNKDFINDGYNKRPMKNKYYTEKQSSIDFALLNLIFNLGEYLKYSRIK